MPLGLVSVAGAAGLSAVVGSVAAEKLFPDDGETDTPRGAHVPAKFDEQPAKPSVATAEMATLTPTTPAPVPTRSEPQVQMAPPDPSPSLAEEEAPADGVLDARSMGDGIGLVTVYIEPGQGGQGVNCFSTSHVPPTVARTPASGALMKVPVWSQLVDFNGESTTDWTVEMLMWRLSQAAGSAGVMAKLVFQPPTTASEYGESMDEKVSPDELITVSLKPGEGPGVVFTEDQIYPCCIASFEPARSMVISEQGSNHSASSEIGLALDTPPSARKKKKTPRLFKKRSLSGGDPPLLKESSVANVASFVSDGQSPSPSPLLGLVPLWSELCQIDGIPTTEWTVQQLMDWLAINDDMSHVMVFRRPRRVYVPRTAEGHKLGVAFYSESSPPRIKRFTGDTSLLLKAGVPRLSEVVKVNEEGAASWTCDMLKTCLRKCDGGVDITFRCPRLFTTDL